MAAGATSHRHSGSANVLERLLRSAAHRAGHLADRIRHRRRAFVLEYADCLSTVEAVLRLHSPVRLCDIGAYDGRWTRVLAALAPSLESAVLFEPQTELAAACAAVRISDVDTTVFRCGLGRSNGTHRISGVSPSASFLAPGEQTRYFPDSLDARKGETVPVRRLDDVYRNERLSLPDLIKLDVQGYELAVLEGGRRVLRGAQVVVVEVSFRQFYRNQAPASRLFDFLGRHGFDFAAHGWELRAPDDAAVILQMDAIFTRRGRAT